MPDKVVVSSGGSGMGILFLVFLVLKLTSVINWSWWWVTAPLWIPFGLGISMIIVGIFATLLFAVFGKKKG